jgi:hypothetical protein
MRVMRRALALPTVTKDIAVGSPKVDHFAASRAGPSNSSEKASFMFEAGLTALRVAVRARRLRSCFIGVGGERE